MRLGHSFLVLALATAAGANPLALDVVHDHGLGSCRGRLAVDGAGVSFDSRQSDHSRQWKFTDIQELKLEPGRVRLLTYDGRRWWGGADRSFLFTFSREEEVWGGLRQALEVPLGRRLVVAYAESPSAPPLYRFAARHRHVRGGCQGVLNFGPETATYSSDEPGESRTWTYSDFESISSSGPFQLTIHTYERQAFHYAGRKSFEFQLKEPLSEAVYNELWRKVNGAAGLEVPAPKTGPSESPQADRLSRLAEEAAQRILSARAAPPPPLPDPVEQPLSLDRLMFSVARVESGFNPRALSPKGARGLWQFMPDTARRYGLRVDSRIDERTNPEKSQWAAARYLADLYQEFGDWKLALAAYNAGEGRVQSLIRRTGIGDFSRLAGLKLLPEETRRYVPAVLSGVLSPPPAAGTRWFALTAPPQVR